MVLDDITQAFALFFGMVWETWWALVLGFTVTGAVETFVSEETMTEALGGDDWEDVAVGTVAGAASSSCSFAATSTAKTLFKKGASAEASIAGYQFAATDLVAELALVMWVLLGWQFVAAEVVGGVLAVAVIAYLWKEHVPQSWFDAAREHVNSLETPQCAACGMSADPADDDTVTETWGGGEKHFCCGGCLNAYENMDRAPDEAPTWQERATSVDGWTDAARNTVKEWDMLWEDIVLGFAIASLLGAFVPNAWWVALFGGTDGLVGVTLAATIGVLVGVVTFLCSVGNIPFALVLWTSGVPFGAIMSFIYADLLIPPLVKTYRRYYGTRMAVVIFSTFALASVVAGVAVHYVFGFAGLIPAQGSVGGTAPDEYTLVMNLLFTPVFLGQLSVAWGREETWRVLRSIPATTWAVTATLLAAARISGRGFLALFRGVRDSLYAFERGGRSLVEGLRVLGRAFDRLWSGVRRVGEGVTAFCRRQYEAARYLWEAYDE